MLFKLQLSHKPAPVFPYQCMYVCVCECRASASEAHHYAVRQQAEATAQGLNTTVTIPPLDNKRSLSIFAGITFTCFVLGVLRSLGVFHILVSAAKNIHNEMFASIIRCPVLFFDSNPVGQLNMQMFLCIL